MADILSDVAGYYSARLAEHGRTPRGVDWNGEDGQRLRFEQLVRIVDRSEDFSVIDLGCGYGAMLDFMRGRFKDFAYTGYDVSSDMIEAARSSREPDARVRFVTGDKPSEPADYCIASGIFNVKLGWPSAEWRSYLERTLDILDQSSLRGFAFNCLTTYSDADKMRDNLYYADPCELFDLCKRHYSRHVGLLHDYGLYEFTILVRKAI